MKHAPFAAAAVAVIRWHPNVRRRNMEAASLGRAFRFCNKMPDPPAATVIPFPKLLDRSQASDLSLPR